MFLKTSFTGDEFMYIFYKNLHEQYMQQIKSLIESDMFV
jgi:hypothetical protein